VARAHEFGWLLCDIGNLMLLSCCLWYQADHTT
jgi:hypothetical protein